MAVSTIHETQLTIDDLSRVVFERRDYYLSIGWDHEDCLIGLYDGELLLACDHGSVSYRDRGDGVITRVSRGVPSKLIEFIETYIAIDISKNNREVIDSVRATGHPMDFYVGQTVRTKPSPFGSASRRSKIAAYYITSTGGFGYRLSDGGIFSADELIAE